MNILEALKESHIVGHPESIGSDLHKIYSIKNPEEDLSIKAWMIDSDKWEPVYKKIEVSREDLEKAWDRMARRHPFNFSDATKSAIVKDLTKELGL